MRKLDFQFPAAKGAATPAMSKQEEMDVARDRHRREKLKRQLRQMYDGIAREELPDALMALVEQIGKAGTDTAGAARPEPDEDAGPVPG